jgi:hypothetical protein
MTRQTGVAERGELDIALALGESRSAAGAFPTAIENHRASVVPDSTLARLAMVAGVRERAPVRRN